MKTTNPLCATCGKDRSNIVHSEFSGIMAGFDTHDWQNPTESPYTGERPVPNEAIGYGEAIPDPR